MMKTLIDHRNPTRRQAFAMVGGAALLAVGARPAFAAKLQPTAVAYQTSPKGDKKCSDCNLYVDPKACKSVDGEISPDGWCRLWVKKA
jgi:hypothetical protein